MGKKNHILFNPKQEQLCYSFYLRIANYLKVKLHAYVPSRILLLCGTNKSKLLEPSFMFVRLLLRAWLGMP